MNQSNFTTTILLDKSPAQVFDAICHVGDWWHGEVTGSANKLGDEFTYRMKTFHFSKQKVVELIPDKKIVWLVTDSDLSFISDKAEWTGTKIVFDISQKEGRTQLQFTHEGLRPAIECYDACSNGWSQLIQKSLLSLINTGAGKEVF